MFIIVNVFYDNAKNDTNKNRERRADKRGDIAH